MSASELTFKEAVNLMTGFDIIAVEKKWNKPFEDLGGTRTLASVIWVLENRKEPMSWEKALGMSLGEYQEYFQDEETADPEK